MPGRLRRMGRSPALGAMVAQLWQAVGSLGLQLLAAWLLGASGLGLLSLCLGIIVLATALTGGMVGDSLVVLDRHDPRVRGGLYFWALMLAGVSMVATVAGLTASGLLQLSEAVLMGFALMAFQVEELVRRVFMATMRFWRLVLIDTSAVLTALSVVGVWAAASTVHISTFFVALLVGQLVGVVVGVAMLPPAERALAPLRGAAIRAVASFGAWRGVQVSVAPSVLTAMRVIVTAVAGAAALGEVELARIYAAPALLAVQGLGSYLLSSYVRDKQLPVRQLRRRAWRASGGMVAAALVGGAFLVGVVPVIAHVFSGPLASVNRLAVVGWVLYVASLASLQPFASLAAARGASARILWCRCIDAALALAVLSVLLLAGVSAAWTPIVLAGGLLIGGVLVRQLVLRPLVRLDADPKVNELKRPSHAVR